MTIPFSKPVMRAEKLLELFLFLINNKMINANTAAMLVNKKAHNVAHPRNLTSSKALKHQHHNVTFDRRNQAYHHCQPLHLIATEMGNRP